jgi:hypothetical protein
MPNAIRHRFADLCWHSSQMVPDFTSPLLRVPITPLANAGYAVLTRARKNNITDSVNGMAR